MGTAAALPDPASRNASARARGYGSMVRGLLGAQIADEAVLDDSGMPTTWVPTSARWPSAWPEPHQGREGPRRVDATRQRRHLHLRHRLGHREAPLEADRRRHRSQGPADDRGRLPGCDGDVQAGTVAALTATDHGPGAPSLSTPISPKEASGRGAGRVVRSFHSAQHARPTARRRLPQLRPSHPTPRIISPGVLQPT